MTADDGGRTMRVGTRIAVLDGLRGIAIVLVFLSHHYYLWSPVTDDTNPVVASLLDSGNFAVSIFFAVGAFLYTRSLVRRRDEADLGLNPPVVAARRYLRLTAQVAVLLLVVAAVTVVDGGDTFPGTDLGASSLHVLTQTWNWFVMDEVTLARPVVVLSVVLMVPLTWVTLNESWHFGLGGIALDVTLMAFLAGVAVATTVPAVVARTLGSRPLAFLGRRSLGIYVWHFPVFAHVSVHGADWEAWQRVAVAWSLSLALAAASEFLIEGQVRHLLAADWWSRFDRPRQDTVPAQDVDFSAVWNAADRALPARSEPGRR